LKSEFRGLLFRAAIGSRGKKLLWTKVHLAVTTKGGN